MFKFTHNIKKRWPTEIGSYRYPQEAPTPTAVLVATDLNSCGKEASWKPEQITSSNQIDEDEGRSHAQSQFRAAYEELYGRAWGANRAAAVVVLGGAFHF